MLTTGLEPVTYKGVDFKSTAFTISPNKRKKALSGIEPLLKNLQFFTLTIML